LERIRDKTGARRRAELVRYAIQAGIDPAAPATWELALPTPDVTGLRAVSGPSGPHVPHPIGPPGPCCQAPAGLTLGLPLRHPGGPLRPCERRQQ